mgnify:CR=1 FL=1
MNPSKTINHKRYVLGIIKILLAFFCLFVLIASIVYHWEFSPYILKPLGILLAISAIVSFFHHKKISKEITPYTTPLYACIIKIHLWHTLILLIGSLVVGLCFCMVDIVLGIGIILYLLEFCMQDLYHKAEVSSESLILYHYVYGRASYKWQEINITSSLDNIYSPMLYVNLSDTYYLHIWYNTKLTNISITKNTQTLKLYEYIKRYKNENNL